MTVKCKPQVSSFFTVVYKAVIFILHIYRDVSEPTAKATSNIKIQMIEGQISYTTRLQQIRTLLAQENPPSADEVQSLLGHGVLAGLFHR